MALIKCPECGKDISENAELCIHCGYPIAQSKGAVSKKSVNRVALIVCAIVAVVLVIFIARAIHKGSDLPTGNEQPQSASNEPLSFIITEMYLDEIYNNFVAIQDTLVDALMSYGEFTTLDDIKNFERPWRIAIDSFDADLETLSQNSSSEEYSEYWNTLYTNLQKFRDLCVPFTNLDPNGDGTYTSEEGDKIYNENVPVLKDTLVVILEDYKDFCLMKEIYAVTVPATSETEVEPEYEENSEKCLQCGKTASYSYTNPFSGEEEPYCYTHYNEIIDMMGKMESDVTKDPIMDTSSARHTDSEAWTCAKKIVKDNLKSPSSAKFCSMSEATISHVGSGNYKVTGWVEAQNSYGAVVREYFVVTYIALSSGYKNASVTFD